EDRRDDEGRHGDRDHGEGGKDPTAAVGHRLQLDGLARLVDEGRTAVGRLDGTAAIDGGEIDAGVVGGGHGSASSVGSPVLTSAPPATYTATCPSARPATPELRAPAAAGRPLRLAVSERAARRPAWRPLRLAVSERAARRPAWRPLRLAGRRGR